LFRFAANDIVCKNNGRDAALRCPVGAARRPYHSPNQAICVHSRFKNHANVLGNLNMTTLFKRFGLMPGTCLVAAFLAPVIALALPDDATLSQLLVGTWKGPRHETQYRADGTWVLDPPDEGDNTRGKWQIEHGRLVETWRFTDETEDSSSVEEIIELTDKIFKSRIILQEGPGKPEGQVLPSETFTVTRVTEKN
jgi:hypothetical protein